MKTRVIENQGQFCVVCELVEGLSYGLYDPSMKFTDQQEAIEVAEELSKSDPGRVVWKSEEYYE